MQKWFQTIEERELNTLRKRYMRSIAEYNKEQAGERRRSRKSENESIRAYANRLNEQAARAKRVEEQYKAEVKMQQTRALARSHDRMIEEQRQKYRRESQRDRDYEKLQREAVDADHQRRLDDWVRANQHHSFRVSNPRHRRVSTEPVQSISRPINPESGSLPLKILEKQDVKLTKPQTRRKLASVGRFAVNGVDPWR